ncbi:MAG: aspartyl protease family protein [Akkermansiaceae bacterium]|nr:aspartyl protease family protein [Akkermansiaceae bacterium]MCP5544737.1 aspartyl protease family protein [Akkermansiaceae bacterium]MCP5545877.1 aspartyl protease family protein [Akkermansiaceae bacterium]
MKRLPILLTAVLLAIVPTVARELSFLPIPVVRADPGGLDLVKVKVEDRDEYFLIDTGCARSMLFSTPLAKELGKELKPAGQLGGIGGKMDAYTTDFETVIIGGRLRVSGASSMVGAVDHLESLQVDGVTANPQGLLGGKILTSANAVFDLGGGRILVPGEGVGADDYRTAMTSQGMRIVELKSGKHDLPFVGVEIGGELFAFLMDTGANANTIEPSLVEHLGIPTEASDVEVKGAGKVAGVSRASVDTLRIPGGVVLKNVPFHVIATGSDQLAPEGMKAGGILGSRLLHQIKARIDFGSRTLVLPK